MALLDTHDLSVFDLTDRAPLDLVARCTCHERRPARVEIMGIHLDPVDMEAAVERCVDLCRCSVPHSTLAINAAKVLTIQDNADDPYVSAEADLVFADGAAVVWASQVLGRALPERVAGIDLFERLLERAETEGLTCYFLGARPAVITELKDRVRTRYPNLRLAGARDGYWESAEEAGVVSGIRAARPDLLFVALPSPAKEIFTAEWGHILGAGLIVGVGGSFDVMAGYVTRAPKLMQRLGLEWLHRLLSEPRKMWRRYVVGNPRFVGRLLRTAVKEAFTSTGSEPVLNPS